MRKIVSLDAIRGAKRIIGGANVRTVAADIMLAVTGDMNNSQGPVIQWTHMTNV